MIGLHKNSLQSWSALHSVHMCASYEVDAASSKDAGVQVTEMIAFPATVDF